MNNQSLETFVPLYISNKCDSACSICNMRNTNKQLYRKEASFTEIKKQLKIIRDIEKINAICFLTGEYLKNEDRIKNINKIVLSIKYAFKIGYKKVYFNIGSLSRDEINIFYRHFFGKNIVLSLFQETYDREVYQNFFGSNFLTSPKANYEKRLVTAENWINAGFINVDIGILLGICDPKSDINNLIIHAKKLYELGANVHISLPRIKGLQNLKYAVNDQDYINIIRYIKAECPWAHLIITTRENVNFIKKVLQYIDIVSPGSSDIAPYTIDGAISNSIKTSQFVVSEKRERPSETLNAIGVEFRYYKEKIN